MMQTSEAARDKIGVLQLPTNDWEELFHILDDDGSGDLDIEEVIVNSLRLREMQTGSSLQQLVLSTHSISRRLDRLMKLQNKTGDTPPGGPRSPRRLLKPKGFFKEKKKVCLYSDLW